MSALTDSCRTDYVRYARPTLAPKVAVFLGELKRFKATLGKFLQNVMRFKATLGDLRRLKARNFRRLKATLGARVGLIQS